MADARADWSRLTAWLRGCAAETVVVSWQELDGIVGGMPASAIRRYPQWWHGDRPNTRAWRAASFEPIRIRPGEEVTFQRTNVPATAAITPTSTAAPKVRSTDRPVGQSDATRSAWSARLVSIDPAESLIVIACSARKATGGDARPHPARWSSQLLAARARLARSAGVDERRLMPAWRRYTGGFYTATGDALTDATSRHANIVPRALGAPFRAFWYRTPHLFPDSITVESLR